jgi:hypothetical protein
MIISTYIISLVSVGGGRPFHPSKFLILEEEDDGRGGGGGRMAATAIYPNVYGIQPYSL